MSCALQCLQYFFIVCCVFITHIKPYKTESVYLREFIKHTVHCILQKNTSPVIVNLY